MCKGKKQDLVTKPSYHKELYNACEYIYENKEEFKDFEIYQSLKVDSSSYLKSEYYLALHNRLISQYRILIGEEKTEFRNDSVKGSDIMPSIDTSCLDNPRTLAHILVVFHHFNNKGETRINQKRRLRSVNVDKPHDMLDYLMDKINSDNIDCNSCELFEDFRERRKEELIQELSEKYNLNTCDKLVDYNRRIGFFTEKLSNDLGLYIVEVGKLSPTFQAWLYIDLCCWSILQFVIAGIMRNKHDNNKLESIEKLNTEILRLIKQENEEKAPIKLDGTPEEMMFKFFSFFYEKDRHLQDTQILGFITKFREKRKSPSPEHSLLCFSPQGKTIRWQEILELFSEGGQRKSLRSFKDSLLKCHRGIFQFNKIAGRNLKPEPITLRAFYKEIYMDDTLYDSRKSMTIFHDFLEQNDMKKGDFYFIDEKINAGIFREYGIIEEFYAKNTLQENLYCLVCYFLAALNPAEIIYKFRNALGNISAVIAETYSGGPTDAQAGICENPKEEKLQAEIKEMINHQKEHVEEIGYDDTKNVMALCFKLYNLKFPDGKL